MFDKIEIFEKRYDELNGKLYDPIVAADVEQYNSIMKEIKEIEPIAQKYKEYKSALQSEEDAMQMLSEGADDELREMLDEEIAECREKVKRCSEELKILLLPKDPNDEKNVIMEIRAGVGGEEAALFCSVLFRM